MNLEKMFKTPKEKFLPDDVKTAHCEAEDLFLSLQRSLTHFLKAEKKVCA